MEAYKNLLVTLMGTLKRNIKNNENYTVEKNERVLCLLLAKIAFIFELLKKKKKNHTNARRDYLVNDEPIFSCLHSVAIFVVIY